MTAADYWYILFFVRVSKICLRGVCIIMKFIKRDGRRFCVTLFPILAFLFLNVVGGHWCSVLAQDSIAGTILGDAVIIIAAGFWYKMMRVPFHRTRDIGSRQGILFTLILLFVFFASQAGSLWVNYILPGNVEQRTAYITEHMGSYLFLTLIVAPIAEELMFRGVFYTQFRKLFRPSIACIVSTVVFAMMHVTPANIYVAAVSGFLFCTIYELTDSLLYSVALHMMYNVLCMTIGVVPVSDFYLACIMQLVMLFILLYLYVKIRRKAQMELDAQQAWMRG